ncbi:hypothetical protein HRbin22_02271 [Candidatus Thermoflexus japonica]|uniref:Uncharacterized protein n=1 Tax=Candidatus Thermoflexus japonica TaxID=2035417 RepID=A0A2H5Y9G6_9CHLR|nr:hypothetical protein HRbin22_02271 [Candidatus Thermoflexus japonica]
MIAQLVAWPVGIDDHDVEIRNEEGEVVVPPVPEDEIPLLLRRPQDPLVVHPGVDGEAVRQVGFVFLPLLDRALVAIEIVQRGEPLHRLFAQVAVGHGVTDDHRVPAELPQEAGHPPGGGALAAAGAHRADGDHRPAGFQLGGPGAHEPEIGSGGVGDAGPVHHILVAHIAVSEHHPIHLEAADQLGELLLGVDGDAVRVKGAGQLGGIQTPFDVRDLSGREGHDLIVRVVPEEDVEVVEVAPRGAHEDHTDAVRHGVRSSAEGLVMLCCPRLRAIPLC